MIRVVSIYIQKTDWIRCDRMCNLCHFLTITIFEILNKMYIYCTFIILKLHRNMKKLFLATFCTLITVSAFSYGNNDGSKLLPSKITDHHRFELSFHYDENNRLIKMIEDEAGTEETNYIYDDNGILREKRISSGDGGRYITKYAYSEEKDRVFVSNFAQNSITEISSTDTLIIDSNGCLLKELKSDNLSRGYIDYSYNADKTLAKQYSCSDGHDYKSEQTMSYVYDKHKSSFCEVNIAPWFFTYEFRHFSQIASPTVISHTGKVTDSINDTQVSGFSQTIVIKYTYNEQGYPITQEMTEFNNSNDSNDSHTLFIEYVDAK